MTQAQLFAGSGGQGGFTDTRDGYGQPKPSSYGQSGSGNYQSSGGNYQSGGAGTGGGNYSNEPLNPGAQRQIASAHPVLSKHC